MPRAAANGDGTELREVDTPVSSDHQAEIANLVAKELDIHLVAGGNVLPLVELRDIEKPAVRGANLGLHRRARLERAADPVVDGNQEACRDQCHGDARPDGRSLPAMQNHHGNLVRKDVSDQAGQDHPGQTQHH